MRGALAKIVHRGPDDEGCYEDAHLSLGHRRLAIIDLATGRQPMYSADGRFVIVFNGEIYNFRELRQRLKGQGHTFRTQSDTEVLLEWLALRGVDGLVELNGMFVFALWDRTEKRLLLARDRLGMKPLYVRRMADDLVFSSEIKAILEIAGRGEADNETILQFVTFQNVLSDRTFFRGIYKLPPGGWLEWTPGRGGRQGLYWEPTFTDRFRGAFGAAVDAYRQALVAAVDRHMLADVPVGTYLSGGIDSSSVTVAAADRTPGVMHTFTGAFVDAPYYDERIGSRAVANQVGAHLHEVEISAADFCADLGKVVYHLDEPTLGTGALPQFEVSKLAARHVKVVLTGHGGDEAFAGYQVNKAVAIREHAARNPFAALRAMVGVRPDEIARVLYFLFYPLLYPEVGHGLFIMVPRRRRAKVLTTDFLGALGDYEPMAEPAKHLRPGMSPGQALMTLYLRTYLPTLFIQEDKVGMAHSLEARMPLCDNELIELALGIGLAEKLHGSTLKAIPKAAMRHRLPQVLFTLPKRGFPTPFALWFRSGHVRELMEDLLLSGRARQRGIFRPEYVAQLFHANLTSRTDTLFDYARANQLYSMAVIELWFRTFVDQPAPEPIG
jgi:asparagine synthase (glutamine-hydrolysing)